jgi:hypothetical protein
MQFCNIEAKFRFYFNILQYNACNFLYIKSSAANQDPVRSESLNAKFATFIIFFCKRL